MIRKAAIVMSLLMALVTLAAWGFSFKGVELANTVHVGAGVQSIRTLVVGLTRGHFFFERMRIPARPVAAETEEKVRTLFPPGFSLRYEPTDLNAWSNFPGLTNTVLGVQVLRIGAGVNVIVPLWWPLVISLLYPTLAFIRGPWRRYRRRKKGHCIKCGYDLTGNESGTCPECGVKVK